MTYADSLAFIPDEELFATVQRLTARSNVALAGLLAHLGEVERRGIHRSRACASLYTYCIYELRMSEDAAFRRSKAARLVREYPELRDAIALGHEGPRRALPDIQLCALRALVKELRARKRAATERPRPPTSASTSDAQTDDAGNPAPEQEPPSDETAPASMGWRDSQGRTCAQGRWFGQFSNRGMTGRRGEASDELS